jgi:uncharacterized protein YeaC (DUF1315 family)
VDHSDDYKRGWFDGYNAGKNANPPDIGRWPHGPGLVEQEYKCTKCGMMWRGIMGYHCPRMDCPIQPKIVAASNGDIT